MGSIIERAKAHYTALPRLEIKVPEWGTPEKPVVVTWKKLTVRDEERIYAPADGKPPAVGIIRVRTLIMKAADDHGAPMFSEMDEHALRYEVDSEVVARIANAILFGAGVTDKAGNSRSIDDQIDDGKNG